MISEVLKKLAPRTPASKRDRFVPFLEEATKRYGIDTELRLAAFLATCCFESDYFRTTVEYRATRGRAKVLQDKYWNTGFYGRGLIQLTHKANYEAFSKSMFGRYPQFKPDLFVVQPHRVADEEWAVESACWFWQRNNLNKYADKGDFFAIQGLVNRGSATKKALEYETRLSLYDIALRAIPDDYSAAASSVPDKDDDKSQPAKESATNAPDQQQSILDRATAPLIAIKGKFDALGVDPGTVSKSSAVTTIVTKVGGWLMVVLAAITDHPLWFVVGGFLIVAAIWYFSRSKDRATKRLVG